MAPAGRNSPIDAALAKPREVASPACQPSVAQTACQPGRSCRGGGACLRGATAANLGPNLLPLPDPHLAAA